jgi:hypothetical protein
MATTNPTSDNSDARDESTDDEQSTFQDRFGFARDTAYAAVVGESINDMRTPHMDAAVDNVDTALSINCDKSGVSITSTAVADDGDTKQGSLAWVTPAEARQLANALLEAADDWEAWDAENSAAPDK